MGPMPVRVDAGSAMKIINLGISQHRTARIILGGSGATDDNSSTVILYPPVHWAWF